MEKERKCNYSAVPLAICIGLTCGFIVGPVGAVIGSIIGFLFAEWYFAE